MLKKLRQVEWLELLQAYDKHLEQVQDAIEGKRVWPGPFNVPAPNTQMPTSLRSYAEDLMNRTAELSVALREKMAVCRQVLEQSKQRSPDGRVVLVDVKA
jgi:hypothetical protein